MAGEIEKVDAFLMAAAREPGIDTSELAKEMMARGLAILTTQTIVQARRSAHLAVLTFIECGAPEPHDRGGLLGPPPGNRAARRKAARDAR